MYGSISFLYLHLVSLLRYTVTCTATTLADIEKLNLSYSNIAIITCTMYYMLGCALIGIPFHTHIVLYIAYTEKSVTVYL